MTRSSLFLAAVAALVSGYAPADDAPAIRPESMIRLFNGKDLSGLCTWLKDTKYEDPREVFTVGDGRLHISGDGLGYIRTRDRYRDYHLVLEFRWGKKTWRDRVASARDSGIIVHCVEPDGSYGGGVFMAGIEAQMIEGGTGDFIVVPGKRADGSPITTSLTAEVTRDRDGESVWHAGGERRTIKSGRINWYGRDPNWNDAVGYRGREDLENQLGQWNRLEVICDGRRIEQRLNGIKCNEGFDAEPAAGAILIQCELAEVEIRRWELWPLDKAPTTPARWTADQP